MDPVKVKVCGLSTYDDARAAIDEGAWALGFVFHAASPRAVRLEDVRAIVERLPATVLTVGVFVDRPVDEVNETVRLAGLKAAQLHGAEDPLYAERVEAEEVWKAFRVSERFDPSEVDAFAPRFRILLDAYQPGRPGGTGETFDWSVARRAQSRRPVILAGGLRAENVADALRAVAPFAVDVSSGVESSPGRKDPARLRELFAAVRAAARDKPR